MTEGERDGPAMTASPSAPRPRPAHRHPKPTLSCNLCKRRKVKCDRKLPCGTCSARGLARACVYDPERLDSLPVPKATTVHERVHELEGLVIALMQQQQQQQQQQASSPASKHDVSHDSLSLIGTPPGAPDQVSEELSSWAEPPTVPQSRNGLEVTHDSPVPSEHGSIRLDASGKATYVGSAHWAAVLDSISELREHLDDVPESSPDPGSETCLFGDGADLKPGPYLFHLGVPQRVSREEILSGIPPRPVADRLVSTYLNSLNLAPSYLHRPKFLREYENFWQNPADTPIIWIGLLFTTMCLATIFQHGYLGATTATLHDQQGTELINTFRQRTAECLVLGRYTRGGPHVLETVFGYIAIETFRTKDAQMDVWMIINAAVHVALRMGLHRDPSHFGSRLTPFEGEMRRKCWATLCSLDATYSALIGLPRLVRPHQTDALDPRNLLDEDFDEDCVELPPGRPESDAATLPMLHVLAKCRLARAWGALVDLTHDVRPHAYAEVTAVERLLDQTRAALPPSLQWRSLTQSITETADVLMQQLFHDISLHRMAIILHRKYLAASSNNTNNNSNNTNTSLSNGSSNSSGIDEAHHRRSRDVCIASAMRILEHQQTVDEETRPFGRLHPEAWRVTAILHHDFLLSMGVLCYYVEQHGLDPAAALEPDLLERILALLRRSYQIWVRLSADSQAAQKAVALLRVVLGADGIGDGDELREDDAVRAGDVATESSFPPAGPYAADSLAGYSFGSNLFPCFDVVMGMDVVMGEYGDTASFPVL